MHHKLNIKILLKYGDADNLTLFIHLLISTFYKIHMGVISGSEGSPLFQSVHLTHRSATAGMSHRQLTSAKHKQLLLAAFFKLRPHENNCNIIKSIVRSLAV